MKKFLALSLLIVGSASFAAVTGTETNVALPIVVMGEVVDANTNLIIESTTAGMKGNEMQFDFGSVSKDSTSKSLQGTFRIATTQGTAFGATDIKVGLDAAGTAKTATTQITSGTGNININYSLAIPTINPATDTEVNGTVTTFVQVDANANTGSFSDRSKSVYVVLTK